MKVKKTVNFVSFSAVFTALIIFVSAQKSSNNDFILSSINGKPQFVLNFDDFDDFYRKGDITIKNLYPKLYIIESVDFIETRTIGIELFDYGEIILPYS